MLICLQSIYVFFFFNDTATTEIYTLSLHDALPISEVQTPAGGWRLARVAPPGWPRGVVVALRTPLGAPGRRVGALLLLGRALTRGTLAPGFPQELGVGLGHVWRLHRRRLRTSALNELTRLLVSTHSLEG